MQDDAERASMRGERLPCRYMWIKAEWLVGVFLIARPALSPSSDRDFNLSRNDRVHKASP